MKVSLISCNDYSESYEKVKSAVDAVGGIGSFVKSGERVVIKPNFVSRKKPGEAATTHPQILRAVIRLVEETGATAIVAESPGGPYNQAMLKAVYSECGAYEATEGTKAELNFNTDFTETSMPNGQTVKNAAIINPVLEADKVISVAKLKTHAMTAYTGAVKNLFGCIPGTHKAELHFRLDDRDAFCSMLVDLYEFINPCLCIMDGVWGMEGDGPTAGKNRKMGVVMASGSGHALDLLATHLIGYAPEEVKTVKNAIDRGLIPCSAEELEIMGDAPSLHMMPDVLKPESHFNLLRLLSLPPGLNSKLTALLAAKPKADKNKCIGCGECMRCCPPGAIEMKNKLPVIDYDKCIKCFCCQELCPKKAMLIHRSPLNRFMLKILK